jgi:hypothetical protein
MGFSRTGH